MWLSDKYCGETLFEGRETDTRTISINMPTFSKTVLQATTSRIAGDLSIGKLDFHKSGAMVKGDDSITSSSGNTLEVPGQQWAKTSPRKDASPRNTNNNKGEEEELPPAEEKKEKFGLFKKSPRKEKKDKKEKKKEKKEKQPKSPIKGEKGEKSPREEEKGEKPKGGSAIVVAEKQLQPAELKAGTVIVGAQKAAAAKEEKGVLMVQKEGKGRLYYRLSMRLVGLFYSTLITKILYLLVMLPRVLKSLLRTTGSK